MPTERQMADVKMHLEWLTSCPYRRQPWDVLPIPVLTGVFSPRWENLDHADRLNLLLMYPSWEGFTQSEQANVIQRVMDGQKPDLWMGGIETDAKHHYQPQSEAAYDPSRYARYSPPKEPDRGPSR